jgi:hypothetical protein
MSVVIFVGLFFAYAFAVRPIFSLPMSSGLLLTAQIVLGIGALVVPLVVFSAIDRAWWKAHVQKVAQQWCTSVGIDFKRAELHKNHFAAVGSREKENIRRRFRMSRHFLVWKINKVEWLDPDTSAAAVAMPPNTSLERTREK